MLQMTDCCDVDNGGTPDLPGHEAEVTRLVVSHDSKRIATASLDGTIIIWDTSRGTVLQEWLAHRGPVIALAFSLDSQQLVSGGGVENEPLVVWDIRNAVCRVASLEGELAAINCA